MVAASGLEPALMAYEAIEDTISFPYRMAPAVGFEPTTDSGS